SRAGRRASPPRSDLAVWGGERDHGSHPPDDRDRQLAADRRHTSPILSLAALRRRAMRSQRRARPMFRPGAQVLWWVHGVGAERGGGMPSAAWVVEKPARQRDAIRMAVGNDRFRLMRVDDHAYCLHHNAASLFDGGGEWDLVTRRDGRPSGRTDAAGRDTDVIEANVVQLAGKYAGLIRRDP